MRCQGFFLHDPIFTEPNDASVMLTLENSITSRVMRNQDAIDAAAAHGGDGSLNEYEVSAMQYVYSKSRVTTRELSSFIGKGSTLCAKTLKGLVSKGLLAWHGSSANDPSQYYSLPK